MGVGFFYTLGQMKLRKCVNGEVTEMMVFENGWIDRYVN